MARTNKLTALKVARINKPGRHADGGGLILQCATGADGSPRKSWIFRFEVGGRERWMGLGAYPDVSVAKAREKAADARRLRDQGMDPLEERKRQHVALALHTAKSLTFVEAAADYIRQHEGGWRNRQHRGQWIATLRQYAEPVLGKIAVSDIDTDLVLQVLRPIWATKTETAMRLRARIEAIINFAMVDGDRANPARWKGHLEHKLDKRLRKVRGVKPLAAMPYDEVQDFLTDLRQQHGIAARAVELLILTAARTSEVIGATWDEIDAGARLWTVPADRMKSHRKHVIPLSDAALAILNVLPREADNPHIFVGTRRHKLGHGALLEFLRDMGRMESVHGFRSSFRDWAGDCTNHPRDVIEAALAHAIKDETEAAYRRGTAIEKRRSLMADWARFCEGPVDSKAEPGAQPDDFDDLNRGIAAAAIRLEKLGKTPKKALALLERYERSPETFNFKAEGWSDDQYLAALKLACFYWLSLVSKEERTDGMTAAWVARLLHTVTDKQGNKITKDMLPDYLIGERVRTKAAENYGSTPADRLQRRERICEIDRKLVLDWVLVKKRPLRSHTNGKRYQAVAAEYFRQHGVKVGPKTVERDLKAALAERWGAPRQK
jgi:integrase